MKDISPKQKQILEYMLKNKRYPSYEETGKFFGMTKVGIFSHLVKLQKMGYVKLPKDNDGKLEIYYK